VQNENGEWKLLGSQHVVRSDALFTRSAHGEPPTIAVKAATLGETEKLCCKNFARQNFSILHSSPVEEKNGIPHSSENGPSAIQGERATSPFFED